MFEWYKESQVCYAYLSDVTDKDRALGSERVTRALIESEWFTRGWTLQELLAPPSLVLVSDDWIELGTKSSLEKLITSITGITHLFNFHDASIAQKMSWAARRRTTRLEDQAYCLMGLFGVNMPLLYGEGKRAFLRLQLEILSKSDDESIFAWEERSNDGLIPQSGLLAESAEWFRDCEGVQKETFDPNRQPHVMTSKGLRLDLLLKRCDSKSSHTGANAVYDAPLNCKVFSKNGSSSFMVLRLFSTLGEYNRMEGLEKWPIEQTASKVNMDRKTVYIKQDGYNSSTVQDYESSTTKTLKVVFEIEELHSLGFRLLERRMWPRPPEMYGYWDDFPEHEGKKILAIFQPRIVFLICVKLRQERLGDLTVIFGTSPKQPWIAAVVGEQVSWHQLAHLFKTSQRWPLPLSDPRARQDRVRTPLALPEYADIALKPLNSKPSSWPRKGCKVDIKIRTQPPQSFIADFYFNQKGLWWVGRIVNEQPLSLIFNPEEAGVIDSLLEDEKTTHGQIGRSVSN